MKRLVFLMLLTLASSGRAAPLYYSFDGLITGFTSYNAGITLDDYTIVPGQTRVSYVFEVDFDRDNNTFSNSAATWHYFYNDLVSGGIINGERNEVNRGYNGYFNLIANRSAMSGGSNVRIQTSEDVTSRWRVQDWIVGQQFDLVDGGYFSAWPGGAVYFYGDVELTSISTRLNPVPIPGALLLFASAVGLLGFRLRAKR